MLISLGSFLPAHLLDSMHPTYLIYPMYPFNHIPHLSYSSHFPMSPILLCLYPFSPACLIYPMFPGYLDCLSILFEFILCNPLILLIHVKNLSRRSYLYHLSCLSNVSYPSSLSLFLRLCNLSYLPFIPFILCITIFLTIQFRTYLVYPFDPTYASYPTYLTYPIDPTCPISPRLLHLSYSP